MAFVKRITIVEQGENKVKCRFHENLSRPKRENRFG